jgi:nuclear GTP-binding protein
MRKEAKKLKALGVFQSKSKKTGDQLPNLYPFKKKLLESIERRKQSTQNKKAAEKLRSKEDQPALDEESLLISVNKSVVYEEEEVKKGEEDDELYHNRQNRRFKKELTQVLEASDIILEVLDARDPLSCRNRDLEAKIMGMAGEKKIILVLNKIDLIPQHVAEKWLKYFRREFATVLFKANTQSQQSNLSSNDFFTGSLTNNEDLVGELLQSSKALGADNLLQLIKNYSKTDGIKQAVTVGLIGYPNVGKSSVINSLKKSKVVGVSSTPGYTKAMQEIYLDRKVKLLDCPGIIFANDDEKTLVLRNIIKISDIKDAISPIDGILGKVNKNQLLLQYEIANFETPIEFLTNLALRRGRLVKGGAPDLENAAKIVLNDWTSGKIQYFVLPPEEEMMA